MEKILYVSTHNKGKVLEIESLCAHFLPGVFSKIEALLFGEVIEDKNSFIGNAQKKALAVAMLLLKRDETNFAVLADDSGLCVDSLNGLPGLQSARWAGPQARSEALIEKLLTEMKKSPGPKTNKAHFTCALSLYFTQNKRHQLFNVEAQCQGQIIETPRGNLGFGYDPIFFFPPLSKTFAELGSEEKNKVSHRSNAFGLLRDKTKGVLWL